MAEHFSFYDTEPPKNAPDSGRRWPGRVALVASGALLAGVPAGYYIWNDLRGKPVPGAAAGELVCPEGEPVVGAWIEPNDHADRGWGAFKQEPGHPNRATFTASIAHSSRYSIHVGCGGTPTNWEHDNPSPEIPLGPMLMQVTCEDHPGVKAGDCTVTNLALPGTLPSAPATS